MGLTINTTPAQVDIQYFPAKLDWKTRNADLQIRQKPPLIHIKTEQPLLHISQYQCFAEEGLKNNIDLMKEQSSKTYRHLLKYIGRVARDGDAMKRIGYHANIMLDIAKRNSVTRHEFGMGYIPKSRPTVQLEGGTLSLRAEYNNYPGEINGVTGKYTEGDIDFHYTPWDIKLRMVSYGSIDIKYTGNNVDDYI